MEFCKDRVFTSLNADELRAGDKVIVADTLDGLKHKVQEGKDILVLQGINPETWGRRFSLTNTDYALAYLVERKENCTNCGAECDDAGCKGFECTTPCNNWKPKTEDKWCKNCGVEVCSRAGVDADVRCPAWQPRAEKDCKDCGNAIDEEGKYCSGDENHHWVDQTGEQKCWRPKAEPHYRPFKDTDELIKVWNKKFYLDFKPSHDPLTMPLIWVRNKNDRKVWLISEFDKRILDYLFTNCEFLDGSPCGVEE